MVTVNQGNIWHYWEVFKSIRMYRWFLYKYRFCFVLIEVHEYIMMVCLIMHESWYTDLLMDSVNFFVLHFVQFLLHFKILPLAIKVHELKKFWFEVPAVVQWFFPLLPPQLVCPFIIAGLFFDYQTVLWLLVYLLTVVFFKNLSF